MYTIVVADDEEELRRAIIRKIDWESTGFRVVGEAEKRYRSIGAGGADGTGSFTDGYPDALCVGD